MTATPTGVFAKFKQQLANGNINLSADTLKVMLVNTATPNFGAAGWGAYSDASGSEITGTGYSAGGVVLSGVSVTITDANSWTTTRAANTAYKVGELVKPSGGNTFLYRCVAAGTTAADVAPTAGTNASPIVVTAAGHGLSTGNAMTISGVTGNTNMNAAVIVEVINSSTYNIATPSTLALINGNGTFGGSPAITLTWPTVIGTSFTDGTVTWVCFASAVLEFSASNPSWSSATITADAAIVYKSGTGGGTSPITNPLICCLGFGATSSTNGTFQVAWDSIAGILDLG